MNAKNYLKQLKWVKNIIESKKEQVQNLREMSTSIRAIDYSKDKLQSSGNADKISNTVARIIDTEHELNDDIMKYAELYTEINAKIQMIPDVELKTVLIDRYINFMTFEKIAEKNDRSIRWIYELHQRALSAFAVILKII